MANASTKTQTPRPSGRVTVRLLGPTSLEVDGRPVALAARLPRGVLAMLALDAGRPVSVDRLIDGLWGDDPPDTATNTIQVYVATLRRHLGAAAAVLHRSPAGYSLEIEPTAVDALRFEAAADVARRDGVAASWQAALDTWNGAPLVDLADLPFAGRHITRLTELRAAAVDERIEADLAAGRHEELVPELEALVAGDPYRERSWRQLIVALYRAGRQADALDTYRRAAAVLRDDLGLDPGPALQALEMAVLNQDPVLDAPAEFASLGVRLPAPTTSTIGRDDDLSRLPELLTSHRLVTLTGPGGIGKTRLAARVGRAVSSAFPDGVVLVDLAALDDPSLTAAEIARQIGIEPSDAPVDALVARLSGRAVLLVLDNVEQLVAAAGDIATLLARTEGLHVLATSRVPLRLTAELVHPVTRLTDADAAALFSARLQAARPGATVRLDPTSLAVLDGLPLAIELVAAACRLLEPADALDRLRRSAPLPPGPRDLPERQRTLASTIRWSTELLSPAARQLLAWIAAFASPFTVAMAEQLAGTTLPLETLADLADSGLVVREGDRHRVPDAIRDAVRAEDPAGAAAARRRHAEWVVETAEALLRRIRTSDEETARLELLAILPDVRVAFEQLLDDDRADDAGRLLLASLPVWFHQGRFAEVAARLDRVVDAGVSTPAVDAQVQVTRGIFAKIRGDEALALGMLRAGIERLRVVDPDAVALVNGLCHLAAMDAESGRHEDAFAHADEAVETARRSVDPGTVPMALDLSAYVARVTGDAARAVAASEAAVALARETTSGQLPYALAGLAAARRDAGRHREAVEAAWEALAAADASPSAVLQAEVDLVAAPIIAGGDLPEAARRLARATATWLATGGVPSALGAAGQLATVVSATEPEATAQLIGAVERLHGKLDELSATADALRQRLGDATFARERGRGTALDPDGLGRLADEVARRLSSVAPPHS